MKPDVMHFFNQSNSLLKVNDGEREYCFEMELSLLVQFL